MAYNSQNMQHKTVITYKPMHGNNSSRQPFPLFAHSMQTHQPYLANCRTLQNIAFIVFIVLQLNKPVIIYTPPKPKFEISMRRANFTNQTLDIDCYFAQKLQPIPIYLIPTEHPHSTVIWLTLLFPMYSVHLKLHFSIACHHSDEQLLGDSVHNQNTSFCAHANAQKTLRN